MHLIEDISYRKPNITKLVIENNKGLGKVVISKDPEQKLDKFTFNPSALVLHPAVLPASRIYVNH